MIKSITLLLGTILTTIFLLSPALAAKDTDHLNDLALNSISHQIYSLKENDKDCGTDVERCMEQGQEDGA